MFAKKLFVVIAVLAVLQQVSSLKASIVNLEVKDGTVGGNITGIGEGSVDLNTLRLTGSLGKDGNVAAGTASLLNGSIDGNLGNGTVGQAKANLKDGTAAGSVANLTHGETNLKDGIAAGNVLNLATGKVNLKNLTLTQNVELIEILVNVDADLKNGNVTITAGPK